MLISKRLNSPELKSQATKQKLAKLFCVADHRPTPQEYLALVNEGMIFLKCDRYIQIRSCLNSNRYIKYYLKASNL